MKKATPPLGARGLSIFQIRLLLRFKHHGMSIDAVAQTGWGWTIREHVAEVAAAIGAANFRADHAESRIAMFRHGVSLDWLEIAGPAATGIELGVGDEQRLIAGSAAVEAFFRAVPVGASKRALGAVFAQNPVLVRRQFLAPLRIGLGYFGCWVIAHQEILSFVPKIGSRAQC